MANYSLGNSMIVQNLVKKETDQMNHFISSSRLLELIITINKQISSSSETQDEYNRELLRALGCLESRITTLHNIINDLKESAHDLHLQISSLESRVVLLETYIEQHIKK